MTTQLTVEMLRRAADKLTRMNVPGKAYVMLTPRQAQQLTGTEMVPGRYKWADFTLEVVAA